MIICYMKVMGAMKHERITKTSIGGLKTQTITRKRGRGALDLIQYVARGG